MIENGYNQNVFPSLEKGKDVLTGGTRPKSGRDKPFTVVKGNTKFTELKKKDLEFVSIDVNLSAGFKTKANPTERG